MIKEDILIGPLIFVLVLMVAMVLRPFISTERQRPYFIPALSLKMLASVLLGLTYQFYYKGGDTFTYFTHGALPIFDAFMDSPTKAFRLIFFENNYQGGIYDYAKLIWVYSDEPSYMVVRLAGLFSILSFGTYSGTTIFFALFSFTGLWAMYASFNRLIPDIEKPLAIAILFVPSVVFWGSGVLKDTVTLGALGWASWAVVQIFFLKSKRIIGIMVLVIMLFLIFSIKKYIVLCFVPATLIWLYLAFISKVKSLILNLMVAPILLSLTILSGYMALDQISKQDPRYALDRLGETAMITAMDIGYWTGKDAGSKYSLGIPDPSFSGMIKKFPAAINVTLFRPFLWEINNPLMLLSGMESLIILLLSIFVLFKVVFAKRLNGIYNPTVAFCLIFSLIFAFAVGISTYNFGTLVRYKIPLLPFYLTALTIIYYKMVNTSNPEPSKIK